MRQNGSQSVLSIEEQLAAAGATRKDMHIGSTGAGRDRKYGNEIVDNLDGRFDSIVEYRSYVGLRTREAAGEITDLRRQVQFEIYVNGVWVCGWKADFVFTEAGKLVIADAKGRLDREFTRLYRLFYALTGIRIRIYTEKGIASDLPLRFERGAGRAEGLQKRSGKRQYTVIRKGANGESDSYL
jgi:hypothetical protein